MVRLETERLIIRGFTSEDWRQLQALAIDYRASDAARFEPPWPTSDEEVQGMAAWFAQGDDYLAVCLKETGRLVGLIAIEARPPLSVSPHGGERDGGDLSSGSPLVDAEGREDGAERVRNLGYVFHSEAHGQGYATEACRAAMRYVFEELGADRILTGTNPDNATSVRLLQRLALREVEGSPGEYTMTRDGWLARSRL